MKAMTVLFSWLFIGFIFITILSGLAWLFEQVPAWLAEWDDDDYPVFKDFK